jgi:hypothetical protein
MGCDFWEIEELHFTYIDSKPKEETISYIDCNYNYGKEINESKLEYEFDNESTNMKQELYRELISLYDFTNYEENHSTKSLFIDEEWKIKSNIKIEHYKDIIDECIKDSRNDFYSRPYKLVSVYIVFRCLKRC